MLKRLENHLEDRKHYLSSELIEQRNLFSKELLEYLESLIRLEISVVKDSNLSDSNLLFLSQIELYKDIIYHNLRGRTLILLENVFKKELKLQDITSVETAKKSFSAILKDDTLFSCCETPERFEVNLYDWQKDFEKFKVNNSYDWKKDFARFEAISHDYWEKGSARKNASHVENLSEEEKHLSYYATQKIMEDYGLKEKDFSVLPRNSFVIHGNDKYIEDSTIVNKGPNLRIIKNTKHY